MFKEKNIENRKLRNFQKQNSDIVKIEGELPSEDRPFNDKYGEFVSSYFAWIGLNRQKNRADELNEMTRKNKYTSKNY